MKTPLVEFLRTGQLGPLACGLSRQEVEKTLGKPDDISNGKKNQPAIWKYGNLQLWMVADGIVFIGLYFGADEFQLPAAIEYQGECPSDLEGFQSLLKEQGIRFQVDRSATFDDQVTLLVGPGIHAVFGQDGDKTGLDSIHYTMAAESISASLARPTASSERH